MMKIFQTQSSQFVALSDMKTFHDRGDLENKVKVQLMAHNKRSCLNASWVLVSSLYLKWILIYGLFVYPIGYNGKIELDS